jgi:phosphoribosylaminoimidazole-succinocarboxamide synthase
VKLVYRGKTKDVFALEDGNYLLNFKDDATGNDGVFDPGSNKVGLTIEGAGKAGLRLTKFFFERIREAGIPTHYVDADIEKSAMIVKPATLFGNGLEVICRYRAVGSFMRRYGMYAKEGQMLDGYVEITLKDDDREDPLITKEGLEVLGLLSSGEYDTLVSLTKRIGQIVKDELAKKGIELYDIKFEFGRIGPEQQVALIDEISGGNMRAFKNGIQLPPLELERAVLAE